MSCARIGRSDAYLWLVGIACAGLLFMRMPHLWPLVPGQLWVADARMRQQAETILARNGTRLQNPSCRVTRTVNTSLLDWLEHQGGVEKAPDQINTLDVPILLYDVAFKKTGTSDTARVVLRPDGRLYSLSAFVGGDLATFADAPGARLSIDNATRQAEGQIAANFGIDVRQDGWRLSRSSTSERDNRRDFTFGWERPATNLPGIKERLGLSLVGDKVAAASHTFQIPPRFTQEQSRRSQYGSTLEAIGNLLLSLGAVGAFLLFLLRLRNQTARLRRAVVWAGLIFVFMFGGQFLSATLWEVWNPLVPLPLWAIQYAVEVGRDIIWLSLVALCIIAAGDAINREADTGRGESLWQYTQGRWRVPGVIHAAFRALPIAFIAGGALAGISWLLQRVAGGTVQLAPRGYTLDVLNVTWAPLYLLGFFFQVALLEELGYRHFATTYLLQMTRKRWLALLVPAGVYGLTHTTLAFLPPSEPFWARPLALTLVGLVWGIAYLRYDALTVILAHWCADLFITGWPRFASGEPSLYLPALITLLVPLLPALWLLRRTRQITQEIAEPE